MNKRLFFGLCFIFIAIVLIANVSAFGVSPGRVSLNFEPDLHKTVTFSLINSEGKDVNLKFEARGEASSFVSLHENSLHLSSSDSQKDISYDINLPNEMSPGLHVLEVLISQEAEQGETSEAFVGATISVVTQIYIYVPYPGKYAEAELNVINRDKNNEVTFIIPVLSRGQFDLDSVKANIDVYNPQNEKIISFNTQEISVKSGDKGEIVYKWNTDVLPGSYRAVATLIYDGETLKLEKNFNIGSQDLELQNLEVNNFNLGEIAKFEMLVENKWSEPIKGAYSETHIYNDKKELMANFKSAEYDIPALSKAIVISYWDTIGVNEGIYDTDVLLKYGDKESKTDLKLDVKQNRIDVIGLGYVISSDSSSGGSSLVYVLVVVIVVLVLINILWFLLIRKKLKK